MALMDLNERLAYLEAQLQAVQSQLPEVQNRLDRVDAAVFSGAPGRGLLVSSDALGPALRSQNYRAGRTGWQLNRTGRVELQEAVIRGAVYVENLFMSVVPVRVCGYRLSPVSEGDPHDGVVADIEILYLAPWEYNGVFLYDPTFEGEDGYNGQKKLVVAPYTPIPLAGTAANTTYDILIWFDGEMLHHELIPWVGTPAVRTVDLEWNNGGWYEERDSPERKLYIGSVKTVNPGHTASSFIHNYFETWAITPTAF